MPSYFVYILSCADGTFYTGITTDVGRRVAEHNGGGGGQDGQGKTLLGARYTHGRRPVKLVYVAECPDRATATREEARIKKLSRKQKGVLVQKYTLLQQKS
jgi:putative endonuclease